MEPRDAPREILITKPSSLGDIVDALPAVGAIRRRFPAARISWLVKSEWAAVLDRHPYVDRVIAVPFRWSRTQEVVRAVRGIPFDWVIDFQGLFRSAALGALTGAPLRVGFADAREGAPCFYSQLVKVASGVTHAVDRCLSIAGALGAEVGRVDFGFPKTPKANPQVAALLREGGWEVDAPFAVIHATSRRQNKCWPAERFRTVAAGLIADGRAVIFIGGDAERDEIAALLSPMKRPAINAAGRLTLRESLSLLQRAALCICNDSGPMHIAAAVGTPVIALFGPTDPRKVGPYGAGHVVIQKGSDCSACSRHRCVRDNACMTAISVEEVQKVVMARWDDLTRVNDGRGSDGD